MNKTEQNAVNKNEQTKAVATLYREGWMAWQIANNLGLPESTVRYILREKGLLKT